MSEEIVHWAAQWFLAGPQLRQRCGWCGAVLIDVDLSLTAMTVEAAAEVPPDDPLGGYPTWEPNTFVAHNGAAWWKVDEPEEIPPGSCVLLPFEITGMAL